MTTLGRGNLQHGSLDRISYKDQLKTTIIHGYPLQRGAHYREVPTIERYLLQRGTHYREVPTTERYPL